MEVKNILSVAFIAIAVAVLSTFLTQQFLGQSVRNSDQSQLLLLSRIEELEFLLEDEIEARLDLQELMESQIIFGSAGQGFNRNGDELSSTQDDSVVLFNQQQGDSADAVIADYEQSVPPGSQMVRDQRQGQRAERRQPDYKQQQLIKSGFAEDEAAWIVQRESEIQLNSLYDSYNLRRLDSQQSSTDNDTSLVQELSAGQQLRIEIGDDYYERYLEAQGLPTSVTVGSVMSSSPGESAGLLPGDTIVSYDGKRVFSLQDVNELTIKGNVGESVLIEVQRTGASVQLAIPRGPIGVTQERGRFGR